ncbi:CAP domain-containing protein [Pseudogracilibacillus sp. ICA-222130]|uniref:CAP domain-containing protein n=1 Tax=Pseudogracilibacillus sp. ICA-222130 TaxID=3134655 RepID=UPI0030C4D6D9
MKRFLLFVITVCVFGSIYIFVQENNLLVLLEEHWEEFKNPKEEIVLNEELIIEEPEEALYVDHNLSEFIGLDVKEIIEMFGEPKRIDPTPYGYDWYVYTNETTSHVQIGIKNDQVNTVYVMGDSINIEPLQFGQSFDEVHEMVSFENAVTYKNGFSSYTFKVKENERKKTPLIQLSNDVFIQCYFDTTIDSLTAIRLIDAETLLQQRMYELEYRGPLPDELQENDDSWTEIEAAMEQQIMEMTNVLRHSFALPLLSPHEEVSDVARAHSKDMYEHDYFAHERPNGEGLKERLEEGNIYFVTAGENIAAQHSDSIAAMFGWLNSEGHREALLNDQYTHLGVGVYRYYYTQNFVTQQ